MARGNSHFGMTSLDTSHFPICALFRLLSDLSSSVYNVFTFYVLIRMKQPPQCIDVLGTLSII
ncbi:hypothetical protein AG1IA_05569 [Rhizoctonia solani AG-1 IA]|uniref:Uncharacterized protein n=1 Tax=Thanatephorus cucumeris (strain AG1-IA) TaxID=983506 RepID=L8WVN4_THACA|nr:hypothetical protein AG1IA_05569 [Rhizoctonia solani AG-1 IA]